MSHLQNIVMYQMFKQLQVIVAEIDTKDMLHGHGDDVDNFPPLTDQEIYRRMEINKTLELVFTNYPKISKGNV